MPIFTIVNATVSSVAKYDMSPNMVKLYDYACALFDAVVCLVSCSKTIWLVWFVGFSQIRARDVENSVGPIILIGSLFFHFFNAYLTDYDRIESVILFSFSNWMWMYFVKIIQNISKLAMYSFIWFHFSVVSDFNKILHLK